MPRSTHWVAAVCLEKLIAAYAIVSFGWFWGLESLCFWAVKSRSLRCPLELLSWTLAYWISSCLPEHSLWAGSEVKEMTLLWILPWTSCGNRGGRYGCVIVQIFYYEDRVLSSNKEFIVFLCSYEDRVLVGTYDTEMGALTNSSYLCISGRAPGVIICLCLPPPG